MKKTYEFTITAKNVFTDEILNVSKEIYEDLADERIEELNEQAEYLNRLYGKENMLKYEQGREGGEIYCTYEFKAA